MQDICSCLTRNIIFPKRGSQIMSGYFENEIKILNVNVDQVKKTLLNKGAKTVFSGERLIRTFDDNFENYRKKDILIRMTEEMTTKLTIHLNNSSLRRKIIKLHPIENAETVMDFLSVLNLFEKTKVSAYRTSLELGEIDFDIDQFPNIPPFLEVDIERLKCTVDTLLFSLKLQDYQIVTCGTEEIFKIYGCDYYSLFSSS